MGIQQINSRFSFKNTRYPGNQLLVVGEKWRFPERENQVSPPGRDVKNIDPLIFKRDMGIGHVFPKCVSEHQNISREKTITFHGHGKYHTHFYKKVLSF